MVITKTPFRMSFFGGGTDMPDFFKYNEGAVLSTTFNKYCYVTVRHLPPFFDYKTHLTYSKMEYVNEYSEIQHPAICKTMEYLDMHNIRLTYDSDLPAKSGLGTSSSFVVGMLSSFYALKGQYVSKKRLADDAIYIERDLCKETGGWQDQIAASFGGLNRINFHSNGYEVHPLIISPERKRKLNARLLMYFTGFTRFSADIQRANHITSAENTSCLKEMRLLVEEAESVLTDRKADLIEFGKLLDKSWKLKRKIGSQVSTDAIDILYQKGIDAGAVGGKLLGAGGGGFILFYVEPDKLESVKDAMKDLLFIPFCFEDNGSQVIHYTPETDIPDSDR